MALNDLNDYQVAAARYDVASPTCGQLWYYGLGIAGEAGEVADKVKKLYREGKVRQQAPSAAEKYAVRIAEDDRLAIVKELGDVLWYVAAVARLLDVSLSEVAARNLEKLEGRRARGALFGSGDDR